MNAQRAAFVALGASQLVIAMDHNLVFVALPTMRDDLGFSSGSEQWVASAYVLALGALLLPAGQLADRLGPRRALAIATGLSLVTTALACLAWSSESLVLARAGQGLAAAALFPATMGLLDATFARGPDRVRALAVWSFGGACGGTIGSFAGGALCGWLGWRASLALAIPVLLVIMAVTPRLCRGNATATHATRGLTVLGIVVGLASVLFGLSRLAAGEAWIAPLALGSVVLAGTAVAIRGTRSWSALRDAAPSGTGLLAIFSFQAAFGGQFFLLTMWLQDRSGSGPLLAGVGFLPLTAAILLGLWLSRFVIAVVGPPTALALGLVSGGGTFLFAAAAPTLTLLTSVPAGIAQGVTWTATWTLIGETGDGQSGATRAGISGAAQQLGGAAGLVLLVWLIGAPVDIDAGLRLGYLGAAAVLIITAALAARAARGRT